MSSAFEFPKEHLHSNRVLYNKIYKTETLVGISINNKLKFDIHAGINGQKPYRNLNALRKITNCMELPRNCILINAFFTVQ